MRGKVLPGMRNLTGGRRRGMQSAVRWVRRSFGRDRGGFGRKVQGCGIIGKVCTDSDQLHRDATNDSKQCNNQHDRYLVNGVSELENKSRIIYLMMSD